MFDKLKEKKEQKRLMKIKDAYLAEYTALCTKYHAQLTPFVIPMGKEYLKIGQRLDSFYEVKTPPAPPPPPDLSGKKDGQPKPPEQPKK